MTREEVIKALSVCSGRLSCSGCPYKDDTKDIACYRNLMEDALTLIEQDREEKPSVPTETVVKHKIVNREDLLSAFHEYVYAQADFYMNYTGRAESPEAAQTCMSEICGAAVLMNNILNPRKEESNAD